MKQGHVKRTVAAWGMLWVVCLFAGVTQVRALEPPKVKPVENGMAKPKPPALPMKKTPFNGKRLGCLMPMTGAYAAYGTGARKGVDLAFLSFIAEGNPSGFKVEYRDTGSDPAKTRQAVRELAELGVTAIIGPVGPAEDAAKEAQALGIPIITLTGKDGITALGDHVFRHFLTQSLQVRSVAEHAFNILELRRFAVLYPDEPYGRDMTKLFEAEVKRRGGLVVASESYAPKTTDFGKQIKKILGTTGKNGVSKIREADGPQAMIGIDGIFIPDSAETVGLILPQLRFYDVNDAVLLGTNLWHSDKLITLAGKYLAQAVIPEGFFAESDEPQVTAFVERFREAYDTAPGFVEAVAYDTALTALEVMAMKPASRKDFRRLLVEMDGVRGVTGVTDFTESGEAEKMIYLLRGNADGFMEIVR